MAPVYSRRRQQRESSQGATSLMDEAAQIMGDRWASLIMRSIFTGVNRFDDIRQDTAIATNILSERLKLARIDRGDPPARLSFYARRATNTA